MKLGESGETYDEVRASATTEAHANRLEWLAKRDWGLLPTEYFLFKGCAAAVMVEANVADGPSQSEFSANCARQLAEGGDFSSVCCCPTRRTSLLLPYLTMHRSRQTIDEKAKSAILCTFIPANRDGTFK